ncbi:hypothetical protein ACH42_07400 [Endozoicomonas sp. (ex Bugula neritina AB1)]|nr:hypothetical protein ACH42_07400 [Endozoicomonas sp. (ex Bugula neritina AB1)]
MSEDNQKPQLTGTDSADTITGTLNADIIDGGAGSDRIVFTDVAHIDTISFINDDTQSDILDFSSLLPGNVDANNVSNFVKVTDSGVHLDTKGLGQFTSENKIAQFASDNPPLNTGNNIQVAAAGTIIAFDWAAHAASPLFDLHSYVSDSVGKDKVVTGTALDNTLQGTDSADTMLGLAGDDTLEGGLGADYYDGGAGNDRYILTDLTSTDVIKLNTTSQEQDVIDISQLLPGTVTADNLNTYVQVTSTGIYVDADGASDFSEDNKIADFADDSQLSSTSVKIQFNSLDTANLNILHTVGAQLATGESYIEDQTVLAQMLRKTSIAPSSSYQEVDDSNSTRAFLNSEEGEKVRINLDDHDLSEVFGGGGDEVLDASTVVTTDAGDENHTTRLYGRTGNDTLKGNDEGGMLNGGEGLDRLEAGSGRDLLIGGAGRDEFSLSHDGSIDSGKSDMLYDFKSNAEERDVLDLSTVLPIEATTDNVHSYVKISDAGVYIDLDGTAQFDDTNQIARFGEKVDIDNLVNIRLTDGTDIQFNRDDAISTLTGSAGSDILKGDDASNTLQGLAGDDILDGDGLSNTQSTDHLYGGDGNDKLYIDRLDATFGTVDGGDGFDDVRIQGSEGESISLDLQASSIEQAFGSDSNDTLDGSGYTNAMGGYNRAGEYTTDEVQRLSLYGRGGEDTISGGTGRDHLNGGEGNDTLSGGLGRDFVAGGAGNDTFVITSGDEMDTLWDFQSTADQKDKLDISALVANDFDYNNLPDYFHVDSKYVYFDSEGAGNFTYNQAVAKLGGQSDISEPIVVLFDDESNNNILISYNTTDSTVSLWTENSAPVLASPDSIDLSVNENATTNAVVGTVIANDVDVTDNLTFSLLSDANGRFNIDSASGEITVADLAQFDFESDSSHALRVQVSDDTRTDIRDYTVNVNDVNEGPVTSDQTLDLNGETSYTFIPENFGFNDPDTYDYLHSVTLKSLPTTGLLQLDGIDVATNQELSLNDIALGKLSFTAGAHEYASDNTDFKFTVSDGDLSSTEHTFNLNGLDSSGEGDNILEADSNGNTFFWSVDQLGTADNPADDVITNFQVGENGDRIDLSDVLTDDSQSVDSYLTLNFVNGDTTINVKPAGDSDVTQKITLEGVDLSSYGGGSTDSEIINNLINDGNLQID